MDLFIDINTGEVSRSIGGPKLTSLVLYLRDILALDVRYVDDGVLVTTTVLAASAAQRIGIKAKASSSETLALSSAYTLVGEVAAATLNLNTEEFVEYFEDNVPAGARDANFLFEVEVTAANESTNRTYLQIPATVRRDVIQDADAEPPTANGFPISQFYIRYLGAITARTGGEAAHLDAIATISMNKPLVVGIFIEGSGLEFWRLAAGSDVEDGTFIVRPDDYHASTNAYVWKRVL